MEIGVDRRESERKLLSSGETIRDALQDGGGTLGRGRREFASPGREVPLRRLIRDRRQIDVDVEEHGGDGASEEGGARTDIADNVNTDSISRPASSYCRRIVNSVRPIW